MPVAKTLQAQEIICDPWEEDGKSYVRIRNPKTGKERKVRWYSIPEYVAKYPEEASKYMAPRSKVLGFEPEGYITIFGGAPDKGAAREWFEKSEAHCNRFWGWHFNCGKELPENEYPENVYPVVLKWTEISNARNELLPEDEIDAIITKKLGRKIRKILN